MSDSNRRTLNSYSTKVEAYVEGSPSVVSPAYGNWLDRILKLLPPKARILEVGSGHGLGASYVERKGYEIEASDAVEGFVELMQRKGLNARKLNLLEDGIPGDYDLILALAVFLHFTSEEFRSILHKIHKALNDNGLLAFSVKAGQGEEWSEHKLGAPRFFHYWSQEALKQLLSSSGFEIIELSEGGESATDKTWIQVTARKK